MANLATIDQNILADSGIDPINFITGTGVAGQITYWSGTTGLTGSNSLLWDAANSELEILGNIILSSATASTKQSINSTQDTWIDFSKSGTNKWRIGNFTAGALTDYLQIYDYANAVERLSWSSAGAANFTGQFTFTSFVSNSIATFVSAEPVVLIQASGASNTSTLQFIASNNFASKIETNYTGGFFQFNTAGSVRFQINNNGTIQMGTFASDTGQRLQVNGDALLRGSGNTSGTNALLVENSDGTDMFTILNNGYTRYGNSGISAPRVYATSVGGGGDVDLAGQFLAINLRSTTTETSTFGLLTINGPTGTATSGTQSVVAINKGFAPTSGNASYNALIINPTINQTGGANGFTRGIYVNPTLTSAADWRSIQWDNNTGWGLFGVGTAPNLLNGRLFIPMGSYDLPALSFPNDTNTGLFSPLADSLELKTGTNNAVVLENAATNVMAQSEALGAFPTNSQNIGVGLPSPAVVAPDGALTANIAIPNTTSAQHRFFRSINISEPNTTSVYAKAAGYNFISLGEGGGVAGSTIIFDIVNGTISGTESGFSATIENVGNGWFRCSLTRTPTAAGVLLSRWIIVRNANSTADYAGDGTSGVYLWGWQMETGLAATSYIATGATAVTRPQAVSLLGSNLYGNLITRRVSAPSLNDFAISLDGSDRLIVKATTGNTIIGSLLDSGQRLQVTGDTLLSGLVYFSPQSQRGILYSGDAFSFATPNLTGQSNIVISNSRATSAAIDGVLIITREGAETSTISGSTFLKIGHRVSQPFAPTSGNATFAAIQLNPAINQVGATGITRGLLIFPTLTSAADWRSIEWTNNTGWGLYGAGTADNYLAGKLGIGSLTLTANTLRISRVQTGATSINTILSSGQINSDVTASVNNFASQLITQAATFTLGQFSHFRASDTLQGAGSTITTNIGFRVDDLTFGTSDFGFYGDLSSGTNKWNLYMNGTADNFLAGRLGIGTTTVPRRLNLQQVVGGNAATIGFYTQEPTLFAVMGAKASTNDFQLAGIGNLLFYAGSTIGNAATEPTNERMRLWGATGNLAIGGTFASDSGERLQVTGDTRMTGELALTSAVASAVDGDFSSYFLKTYSQASAISNRNLYGLVSSVVFNLASGAYSGSTTYNATAILAQASIAGNTSTISTQPIRGVLSGIVGSAGSPAMNISDFRYFDIKAPDDGAVFGHIITDIYGLRIAVMKGASNYTITNGWGIYQEGTSDNNYFAGKVLIGTATPGGSPLRLSGLPTSATGLSAGDVWNNGGTLRIV